MTEPMTALEARDYAPLWGSYMTSGDPGAGMYGLDDRGRPDDDDSRWAMIEHIDSHCLLIARERIASGEADGDESEDVEKLEALKAYLEGVKFPAEPNHEYQFNERGLPEEVNGINVEEFAHHYVTAMLWSSSDGDTGENLDDLYGPENLSWEAWEATELHCRQFLKKVGHLITPENYIGRNQSGASLTALAGHDFWLTRVGHGAGFWDGDWKSDDVPGGHREGPLSAASKEFGDCDPYAGDDGLIYL